MMKRVVVDMIKLSRKYRQIVKIMLDRTHIEPSKDQLYWQIHALGYYINDPEAVTSF